MRDLIKNFTLMLLSSFTSIVIILAVLYSYGKRTIYDKELPYWGYPKVSNDMDKNSIEINGRKYSFTKNLTRITSINYRGLNHLIFAGGSNVFGQNLADNETLANVLSEVEAFKNFRIELFSFFGWGPNNILAFMEKGQFESINAPATGVMIYYFILDHINRACGTDAYLEWNKGRSPRYTIENGKAIYAGLHRESLSYKFFLVKRGFFKLRRNIFNEDKIEVAFTVPKDKYCLTLFAKTVAKIREEYLKRFPQGKFISLVMSLDDFDKNSDVLIRTKDAFDKEGLFLHDFHERFEESLKANKLKKADIFFPDSHANKLYHQLSIPFIHEIISKY